MAREKEWGETLRKSYNGAIAAGVNPNTTWGSQIERDMATRLNLDSCSNNMAKVQFIAILSKFKINLK